MVDHLDAGDPVFPDGGDLRDRPAGLHATRGDGMCEQEKPWGAMTRAGGVGDLQDTF